MSQPLVLVVDDDAGTIDTLGDILSLRGYDVAWAPNGATAVSMVRETLYAAVLMDIQMPGLNGVEALRAMKAIAPRTPVLMMTAFTRHELVEEARRGAVQVLGKPLDMDHTLALIGGAVGGAA